MALVRLPCIGPIVVCVCQVNFSPLSITSINSFCIIYDILPLINMPDALYHIRADYTRLCTRVSDALRTLLGDYVQLQQRRREVMNFLNTSTQV